MSNQDIYTFAKEYAELYGPSTIYKITATIDEMLDMYFGILERNGLKDYHPANADELCKTLSELAEKEMQTWKMYVCQKKPKRCLF